MAGTPGACSQVFCHPISCTWERAWTDTPFPESSEPHTHHHTHHKGSDRLRCFCVASLFVLAVDMMNVERDGDGGTGCARRRRERRLRSFLRHERMAVAVALAERLHHSANVTDSKKEEVEQVWYNALRGQKTARAGGGLLAPLSEVAGRQEVLVRHVVEHMADVCPVVQTVDAPVPQMVDTVLEFFRALDLPVDEQVIAVPKISTDRVSQRLVERRVPQMVEQLVEVPTIISYSSLFQRTLEQNVDIPTSVHGVSGSLQGFLPEQYSSQRTASQIADIPVLGRGGSGSRLGFPPEQSTTALHVSQERISERIEQIGSQVLTVFFFSQDRVQQQHVLELVSVMEVFRALSQDRVQQCLLELSLVLAVKGLAQDRVQQRFVDAGLLDRSSWSLTLPGVWASSSPRQRRPSWPVEATSASPRPTWGAFSQVTTSRSLLGSCPLVGGKRSTWRSCKG